MYVSVFYNYLLIIKTLMGNSMKCIEHGMCNRPVICEMYMYNLQSLSI